MRSFPTFTRDLHASLQRRSGQFEQFSETVAKELAEHPEGLTVDELYQALHDDVPLGSYVTVLIANQFPVFSTFMKLTLLNHLLLRIFHRERSLMTRLNFSRPFEGNYRRMYLASPRHS